MGWRLRGAAIVLVVAGWRLGLVLSVQSAIGLLILISAIAQVPALVWRMVRSVRTVDLAAFDDGSLFAAVDAVAVREPDGPATPVRVTITRRQIQVVPVPGVPGVPGVQDSPNSLGLPGLAAVSWRVADVARLTWTSYQALGRPGVSVRMANRAATDTLMLTCSGRPAELEHLRRTLLHVLPDGVMRVVVRSRTPAPAWVQVPPIAVGIAAVAMVVGLVQQHFSPAGPSPAVSTPTTLSTPAGTASISIPPVSAPIGPTGTPHATSILAAPGGYLSMADEKVPLALGKPWGDRCVSLNLDLGPKTPKTLSKAVAVVVPELIRSVPLDIKVTGSQGPAFYRWQPADGAPARGPWGGIGFVDIPVTVGSTASGGHLQMSDDLVSVTTRISDDGAHARFAAVQARIPASVVADSVLTRKAVRLVLARSFGLMYSERTGSGLRRDLADSIDGFSPEDVRALRVFSGCQLAVLGPGVSGAAVVKQNE